MDATTVFQERSADVAAFSALLFCRSGAAASPTHSASPVTATGKVERVVAAGHTLSPSATSSALSTPAYRRPASANVPVSRVVREAKARAARQLRASPASAKRVDASAPRTAVPTPTGSSALGFSLQEIRDRTFLWMANQRGVPRTGEEVARYASRQSATLTEAQQAQLRRLRIKRRHQHVLSHTQWALYLRRRRRLWQRRRPLARRRHLRRSLELQHGRPLEPCQCLSTKRCRRQRRGAVPSVKRRTQWLPSHARLVKRLEHRVLAMALPAEIVHQQSSRAETRGRPVTVARVSVPAEPKRKGHRLLQRWATALGAHQHDCLKGRQQRRRVGVSSAASPALEPRLVADVSHQCVYSLRMANARLQQRDEVGSASWLLPTIVEALGLRAVSTLSGDHGPSSSPSLLSSGGGAAAFFGRPHAVPQRGAASTEGVAVVVVHGHMWAASEGSSRAAASTRSECHDSRRRVSTLARHTRVVPVVLLGVRPGKKAAASSARQQWVLVSEAPVLITRRAQQSLVVRLVSAWSPCCCTPLTASVYEMWRWDIEPSLAPPPSAPSHASRCPEEEGKEGAERRVPASVLQTAREAFGRCVRLCRQLRRRSTAARTMQRSKQKDAPTKGSTKTPSTLTGKADTKKKKKLSYPKRRGGRAATASVGTIRKRRRGPRLSLVVFPSLPAPFLQASPAPQRDSAGHRTASQPFAWRMLFLYHRSTTVKRAPTPSGVPPSAKGVGAGARTSGPTAQQRHLQAARARRAHFHLARRFFGRLLTTTPSQRPQAGQRTRVLGLHDRAALLRLVGCPAYPLDYGQSRPSLATQQRWDGGQPLPRRELITGNGTRRRRARECGSEVESDATRGVWQARGDAGVPSLPSYVHSLEYYGSPSNAACRVTVRSALPDRKLPRPHCTVGSVLLRCSDLAVAASTPSTGRHPSPAAAVSIAVERVGLVSSSPFFSQRLGCLAAAVWCCFPVPQRRAGGAVPAEEEAGPAEGSGGDTVWTAGALTGVAAPTPRTRRWFVLAPAEAAEALLRLSGALQRAEPPRLRVTSRHQRSFDLTRGRTARELESLLFDPTFCTTVELIHWYA